MRLKSFVRSGGLLALLSLGSIASAEPVHHLASGVSPARATLKDANWVIGTWRGAGMGRQVEEAFSVPAPGVMVGYATFFTSEGVTVVELFTIKEKGGSLVLAVRVFDSSLAASNFEPTTREIPLESVDAQHLFFDGVTMSTDGHDGMRVTFPVGRKDGAEVTDSLVETRVGVSEHSANPRN